MVLQVKEKVGSYCAYSAFCLCSLSFGSQRHMPAVTYWKIENWRYKIGQNEDGCTLAKPNKKKTRKECIVHLWQAGLVYHKAWTMISLSMAIMFMRTHRRVALAWPSPFMHVSIFQKTCNHKPSCCYQKNRKWKSYK